MNGASAQRGDIVRNRTTQRIGHVVGASQFGRIIVELPRSPEITETSLGQTRQVWERWDTQVILKGDN